MKYNATTVAHKGLCNLRQFFNMLIAILTFLKNIDNL